MEGVDEFPETVETAHRSPEGKDDVEPGSKRTGSKLSRKRTKTGCLTCRRRRIKCGEERPTCNNCIKSKRQCEGYNQRVVFKDPLSAYRGPPLARSSQVSFTSEPIAGLSTTHYGQTQQPLPVQAPLPIIAPKPSSAFGYTDTSPVSGLPPQTAPSTARTVHSMSGATPTASNIPPGPGPLIDTNYDTVDRSHLPEAKYTQPLQSQASHYNFNSLSQGEIGHGQPAVQAQGSSSDWATIPGHVPLLPSEELSYDSDIRPAALRPFSKSYRDTTSGPPHLDCENVTETNGNFLSAPPPTGVTNSTQLDILSRAFESQRQSRLDHPQTFQGEVLQQQRDPPQSNIKSHGIVVDYGNVNPQALPGAQYYPIVDDDISDEDVAIEENDSTRISQGDTLDDHLRNNDLGIVVALQALLDTQDVRLRSFTSFIDRPDMLATYMPSSQSSPLRDGMTARIFCHFINVTGPSMSMFERHPANPSLMFQGQPVPRSQQHIWAYTFPTLALGNPALLHAMLAVASLQLAKLQNGPITSSLKHYAYALRRIAKSVGLPSRRGQPATLAATMLLGFYELWSADHQKWSNHLLGAKQLVREIDFAGIAQHIKAVKAQQRQSRRANYYHGQEGASRDFFDDERRYRLFDDEVDENIVGMLMGRRLHYDQYGQILDDNVPNNGSGSGGGGGSKTYTQGDLDIYENQRDLFWWYCKQDVYQSILGGGRLFMDYDIWGHCPPRAPLGRLNATYGTFDHLILLMGRLADFAAKDLKRKRRAMKANGGHWRPPVSMQMSVQQPGLRQMFPAASPHIPPTLDGLPEPGPQQGPPTQMPEFAGMIPTTGEVKLPMGFSSSRDESPQNSTNEDLDLELLTHEAEEEWLEICSAFSLLEENFGDDFQALGPEFSAPIQTPFGTALEYRTYGIAGIWMNFYMGLIACHRAHPSMPPAAIVAASIAARHTTSFANKLGRIAAGISPDISMTTQVNTGVGAALIESSTCLFVSGVQYQDAAQRMWTVNRLRDIARLTAWQTANAIATGCETSWIKTAELGKGPPYARTGEERVVPDVWNSSRRIDKATSGICSEERRLVISRAERIHYALGILGVQEDFELLDLDNEKNTER